MSKYQFMGELFSFAANGVAAQRAVDDICKSRHKGNPNSESAFEAIRDRLTEQQNRVLKCLRDRPDGLIAEEIAEVLGVTVNCISGRVSELVRDGKVRRFGRRRTRGGHPASVNFAI